MNTLSSSGVAARLFELPVLAFQYEPPSRNEEKAALAMMELPRVPEIRLTEEVYRSRLAAEREAGAAEMEARIRREYEQRTFDEATKVGSAVKAFEQNCQEYFAKVEREIVQLALGIARKILHRESQVDPTLVAAIVQIALGQLKEGSVASLKVGRGEGELWRRHFAELKLLLTVSIVEDADLEAGDCLLETEVGQLNVSVDGQLKEIERGFLDVLAQRPRA